MDAMPAQQVEEVIVCDECTREDRDYHLYITPLDIMIEELEKENDPKKEDELYSLYCFRQYLLMQHDLQLYGYWKLKRLR